jgi:catechol 2,3-dioxygenase-like lactoylglutathione lyase family enzyme
MSIAMNFTKRVVRDVEVAERFYVTMGLKVVARQFNGDEEGGDPDVAQEQRYLSATGDASSHQLILCRFLKLPLPSDSVYPGEAWLVFTVADVEAAIKAAQAGGGRVVKPGQDRPEHSVRAAVVADPEGHLIELVGPMGAS